MATNGGRHANGRNGNGRSNGNGKGGRGILGNDSGNRNGGPDGWTTARRRRRSRLQRRGTQGLLIVGGLGAIGILGVFIFSILAAIQVGTSIYTSVSRDLPSVTDMRSRNT